MSRQNGTVKSYNDEKGYGWITPESGADLFVHFRAIEGNGFKSLKDGQHVTFEAVQGQKGMQADKVRVEWTPGDEFLVVRPRQLIGGAVFLISLNWP